MAKNNIIKKLFSQISKIYKMFSQNSKINRLFSKNNITIYIVVAIYAAISTMLYTGSLSRQLTNMVISVSCYVVLAVSLNLVVGFLGELSLGHACFMSVGLFSGCIFSVVTREMLPLVVRLPISMIVGGLFAAVVGFIVGLPALRLKGDYLAIVTLACGEIVKNAINNLNIVNKDIGLKMEGALGLNTRIIQLETKKLLPFAIVLVFITIIVIMNIGKSKAGRNIMAIRDNRIAAESIGINITYYKLIVFVLAAFFAGMAGTLSGHNLANVKANAFDYNISIEILVIVVLGGMGSVRGSVIAAIILRVLPELLREFNLDDYRMLVYSVLLIVIMILNANPRFAEFKGQWSIKNIVAKIKKNRSEKITAKEGASNE